MPPSTSRRAIRKKQGDKYCRGCIPDLVIHEEGLRSAYFNACGLQSVSRKCNLSMVIWS